VQVDPNKPTLKAPGTKHSELQYDKLLSNLALKFNLRRSILDLSRCDLSGPLPDAIGDLRGLRKIMLGKSKLAGAYLHSSTFHLNQSCF